ncbi:hypothetical protein GW17_00035955 [Ensete ventricosum]|nr:hypothetical protein GW17_00035955 [Ensete ventricosum]
MPSLPLSYRYATSLLITSFLQSILSLPPKYAPSFGALLYKPNHTPSRCSTHCLFSPLSDSLVVIVIESTMKKDCGIHGEQKRHKLYRHLFATFLVLLILAFLAVLVVWLVLRPTKPKFYLQDADLLRFNLTPGATPLLTSVVQVTLSSRNPNDRIGVYYDRIDAYVLYKSQQVTAATALPSVYQGHNDVTVWSPYLSGADVPLAPYLADALSQDENAGYLLLYVRVDGLLRWKVGTWISGHYHLQANCPAFLTVDTAKSHGGAPPLFRFQQITVCSVDV